MLRSSDWEDRRRAVTMLSDPIAHAPWPEERRYVEVGLQDPSPKVRSTAMFALCAWLEDYVYLRDEEGIEWAESWLERLAESDPDEAGVLARHLLEELPKWRVQERERRRRAR